MPSSLLNATVQIPGSFGSPVIGTTRRNRGTIRAAVAGAIGSRSDVQESQLNDWIDEAVSEIATMIELDGQLASGSFSTAVGEAAYLLPVGISVVRHLALTAGSVLNVALTKMDPRQYPVLREELGYPSSFFRQGKMLVLWPTPAASYEMTFTGLVEIQPMTSDLQLPAIDTEWYTPLIDMCISLAYSRLGETDLSAQYRNTCLASIRSKIDKRGKEQDGVISGVTAPRTHQDLYGSSLYDDDWRR